MPGWAERVTTRSMSESISAERIAVVVGRRSVGVTVSLGEVIVTVNAPAPANLAAGREEQARGAALRQAARALEVALQEVRQELDEGRS